MFGCIYMYLPATTHLPYRVIRNNVGESDLIAERYMFIGQLIFVSLDGHGINIFRTLACLYTL
jgi:hypothetical protein